MPMHTVTPAEMLDWIREHRAFQLLDVREQSEREETHIGGNHIPLGQLPNQFKALTTDLPVIVYCRSGGRSQRACAFLSELGYEAYNLEGGISRYQQENDAT